MMLRLSKMTDYGTVVLAHMAHRPDAVHTAAELSEGTHINPPTVSKLLKLLTRGGLLASQRGARGGYAFARSPARISAADIINAIEGSTGITECAGDHSSCSIEAHCDIGGAWQRINLAIQDALKSVSLADLAEPANLTPPLVRIGGRNNRKIIPIKVES